MSPTAQNLVDIYQRQLPYVENFPVEVINLQVIDKKKTSCIYVGRGKNSLLGNPFYMKDEKQRNRVCNQYEDYFFGKLQSNSKDFVDELSRLIEITIDQGYIRLGCFCAPKRCHADTIKRFIDNSLNI